MIKKNVGWSKFENGLLTRTVCPRRMSFSQLNVLMSTPNCEKDSLFGQTVLVKRPFSNFDRGHFFWEHHLCWLLIDFDWFWLIAFWCVLLSLFWLLLVVVNEYMGRDRMGWGRKTYRQKCRMSLTIVGSIVEIWPKIGGTPVAIHYNQVLNRKYHNYAHT